jgi:nardilysin
MTSASVLTEPLKSPQDKRHYRLVKLQNGLTALLISDPEMAHGFRIGENGEEGALQETAGDCTGSEDSDDDELQSKGDDMDDEQDEDYSDEVISDSSWS